ncbi:MAG: phosphoribosylformylglycinamidine cyclo-ligase [Treponema sp.]|jgi:phosphoribosylformylglycinamidine cyclo-ligase|nr:phosphoribosylformylglycinamidine cyclo-ligase [Treponema sp.]
MDYKQAGVDIEEGYRAVEKYRELAASASGPEVLNGIGSFAGMFSLGRFTAGGAFGTSGPADIAPGAAGTGMEEPVLVSGTDGVGTKLELAFRLKKYDTVGIDCVAMCANDVLCHGARPLFFLDYLACGKLDADVAALLVRGVARGCRETGMALLGGETAEMPGFYDEGKYDIAGFAVGIVDRKNIIDGKRIRAGDSLVGIASSGAHSNGFSLIRKLLPNLDEDFGGMPLGMALLEPTRLYVKPVLGLLERVEVRGMAHITGGGFYENIPRMFGPGTGPGTGPGGTEEGGPFAAVIRSGSWTIPPLFARIASALAGLPEIGAAAQRAGAGLLKTGPELARRMFGTFNMGIGFVLALPPGDCGKAIEYLGDQGFPAWEIGRVERAAAPGLRFK